MLPQYSLPKLWKKSVDVLGILPLKILSKTQENKPNIGKLYSLASKVIPPPKPEVPIPFTSLNQKSTKGALFSSLNKIGNRSKFLFQHPERSHWAQTNFSYWFWTQLAFITSITIERKIPRSLPYGHSHCHMVVAFWEARILKALSLLVHQCPKGAGCSLLISFENTHHG